MSVPRLKVLVVGCSSGVGLQVLLFYNFGSNIFCSAILGQGDSMMWNFSSGYEEDGNY